MSFGPILKLLRTGAGVGLRQLAAELGVSSAYISRVEHGHDAPPTPDRLVEIARVLRLPADVLLELSDQVMPEVTRYLARVPTANALFLEIARRDLSPAQIAHLRALLDREFPSERGDNAGTTLSSVLRRENVIVGLSCATLEDAVDLAAMRLAPHVGRSAQELARKILARETSSPSAIGGGVAIPHVAWDVLQGTQAVVITLAEGLKAPIPDRVPIRLVFALATNDQPAGTASRLLAACARIAKGAATAPILAAREPEAVLRAIADHEAVFG